MVEDGYHIRLGRHPDHVPHPWHYPLVVRPIVGTTPVYKVLMDGGSGLNILYADNLDKL